MLRQYYAKAWKGRQAALAGRDAELRGVVAHRDEFPWHALRGVTQLAVTARHGDADKRIRAHRASLLARQLAHGAYPSGTFLQAKGRIHEAHCPYCGAPDTIEHRLTCAVYAQTQDEGARFRTAAAARAWQQLVANGAGVHARLRPGVPTPDPASPQLRLFGKYRHEGRLVDMPPAVVDKFLFAAGATLYMDGSCFDPTADVLAHAGFAIVQIDPVTYDVVAVLYGPVPGDLSQTAAMAEHFAMYIAAQHTRPSPPAPSSASGRPGPDIATLCWVDCASVVASHQDRDAAITEGRPFAGLWLHIPAYLQVRKTAAHRTRAVASEAGDLANWTGNDHADHWAKAGARAQAPPAWQARGWTEHLASVKHAIQAAAWYLGDWLTMSDAIRQGQWTRVQTARPGDQVGEGLPSRRTQQEAGHAWVFSRSTGCDVCCMCGTRKDVARLRACTAGPLDPSLLATRGFVIHHTHRPVLQLRDPDSIGGDMPPLVYCNVCSSYSVRRIVALAAPCTGDPRRRVMRQTKQNADGGSTAAESGGLRGGTWGGWTTRLRRARRGLHPCVQRPLDWAPSQAQIPLVAYGGLAETAPAGVTPDAALRLLVPAYMWRDGDKGVRGSGTTPTTAASSAARREGEGGDERPPPPLLGADDVTDMAVDASAGGLTQGRDLSGNPLQDAADGHCFPEGELEGEWTSIAFQQDFFA